MIFECDRKEGLLIEQVPPALVGPLVSTSTYLMFTLLKRAYFCRARQFWHAGSTIKDSVYLFGGFKHANVHSRYEVSSSELMKVSITPNTLHSLAAESIATFIVASHENYENDTRWNLLNEFLMPKDITFIQKTAKRLFYLKCHNAKQAFSTPPSSA